MSSKDTIRPFPKVAELVPKGWDRAKLDHVTTRGSGHTPDQGHSEYWNGGIKWVSLADSWRLDRGYIDETEKEISELGIRKSSAVLHKTGTVILSRDAGVGKSGVLKSPMAVSQHFIAWDCDAKGIIDPWFLYAWLQVQKPFFERMAVGSTIKTIGLPLFRQVTLDFPCLPEQRKIAQILGTWDEMIERVNAVIDLYTREHSAVCQRIFEKDYASRVSLLRAREVFTTISERARPELPLLAVMQDIGIVRRDELDRRVTMPDGDTSNYKVVRPGDFVISLRSFEGGLEYSNVLGLVSPAYTVLRSTRELCAGYYRQFFKSRSFVGRLDKMIFGIRDGKQIAFRDFGDMFIPCPRIEDQKHHEKVLDTAAQLIEVTLRKKQALESQKRGLMQKLLTGTWRVKV
jgi:type I restriction enzyme S subunit